MSSRRGVTKLPPVVAEAIAVACIGGKTKKEQVGVAVNTRVVWMGNHNGKREVLYMKSSTVHESSGESDESLPLRLSTRQAPKFTYALGRVDQILF